MILRVDKKNHIKLSSAKISKKRLENFVYDNRVWILQQQARLKDPYELDSAFYYFGKNYRIKHHTKPLMMESESVLIDPDKAKIQSDSFYRSQAQQYLPNRLDYWKKIMDLEPSSLSFRLAKRRWGSCSSKGNISLNPYMMKLHTEMIDYIIVHELAHLVHLNHSKKFYALIESYIPNYKDIENGIKDLSLEMA